MEHTDLELYIQIRDGQPHEHPIFADNFKLAFPDVNVNELPADRFAKFIRVDQPAIGTYEVYEGVTYQWVDGAVKDVHSVRPMTAKERTAKTAELTKMANQAKLDRIALINDILTKETDETAQSLWLECLTAHEAWVLESVNPITPPFPLFPRKDEAGNWVAP
jgi:L-rhamnose isomerase